MNQRMMAVVRLPARADANLPTKRVRACCGIQYCSPTLILSMVYIPIEW
ncbi:Uncharacterised protein [Vibrio cholerae]|nr:Uncharacterised protein [Vibrio cholerae]